MVHIFQYIGERSNCILIGFLFQISKIFKNLVNNILLAHLNKCGPFSDTQYSSRSSFTNANLLTVVSGRIVTSFKKFGTTEVVAIDISETFDRLWHADHLHKFKSYGISGWVFGFIF